MLNFTTHGLRRVITIMLSKILMICLITACIIFLCSASLQADNSNAEIIHLSGDKLLVDNASGLSSKVDKALITPDEFLDAVRSGDLEKVKTVLAQGIDINVHNEVGEFALHLVKDVTLAKYLISHGADVNLHDKQFGMTPLFFQEVPVAKLLVAAGANVNAQSDKGNTPMIWFAYSNYLEGIRYLVSVGADIQVVNHDGKTILDVAEDFGSPELVEYLHSIGATTRYKK